MKYKTRYRIYAVLLIIATCALLCAIMWGLWQYCQQNPDTIKQYHEPAKKFIKPLFKYKIFKVITVGGGSLLIIKIWRDFSDRGEKKDKESLDSNKE